MAMLGDLRRRVDLGESSGNPQATTAVALPLDGLSNPLVAGPGHISDDAGADLEGEWTQEEWEAHELYFDEAASFSEAPFFGPADTGAVLECFVGLLATYQDYAN